MGHLRRNSLFMTTYDNLWQLMTTYDNLWQPMTAYDNLWQLMTTMTIHKMDFKHDFKKTWFFRCDSIFTSYPEMSLTFSQKVHQFHLNIKTQQQSSIQSPKSSVKSQKSSVNRYANRIYRPPSGLVLFFTPLKNLSEDLYLVGPPPPTKLFVWAESSNLIKVR